MIFKEVLMKRWSSNNRSLTDKLTFSLTWKPSSVFSPCSSTSCLCWQSDGPYSGHSSSNTLSSTASSGGHSDSDKWYEMGVGGGSSGDQAETEPNGLGGGGYLQGASADSGIDTSSYGAPHHSHSHSHHGSTTSLLAPSGGRESRERSVSPWHSPTEGGRRMLERSPAAAESPGPPGERSLDGTGRTPPTHLLVRDSSTYSLSDGGSHPRSVCVFLKWLLSICLRWRGR